MEYVSAVNPLRGISPIIIHFATRLKPPRGIRLFATPIFNFISLAHRAWGIVANYKISGLYPVGVKHLIS